jgi:hypothetical protein
MMKKEKFLPNFEATSAYAGKTAHTLMIQIRL